MVAVMFTDTCAPDSVFFFREVFGINNLDRKHSHCGFCLVCVFETVQDREIKRSNEKEMERIRSESV